MVMNLLLWKVSKLRILKTRLPKDKLFVKVCSFEESCKSFKSRPYLTSHATRIKEIVKPNRHLNATF